MKLLPAIEIETKDNPDTSIIWLHGLGADGNDFAPIIPELRLPESMAVRFIFPHAPQIPVTVNEGYVMPAWYDILEMEIDRKVDTEGLLASANEINGFIENELERGIDSRRIIVIGFSQGGAVAYQVALSHAKPLGGLLAMSCYFATSASIQLNEANKDLSLEIHHGTYDPVVPESLGKNAAEQLKNHGYIVNFRSYPMEHGVCPQQIEDISKWLQQLL
ncbi:MAG: dienelactone hydrolase family protein [Desulfobulbaceae bacterium]|uniref:Dienelactone hydrolase family protein n=1 Tax=Candidatus Desulfobia pelagia TaxID=2841692 RepID=A0A8J6NGM4_9BACT|nr:dienelactone hydrolase family protein [Candidatus Desulfobia pelagia]